MEVVRLQEESSKTDQLDLQCKNAKAYLLQSSSTTKLNLYDHLTNILTKLLSEKPPVENILGKFQDALAEEKRAKLDVKTDTIQDVDKIKADVVVASQQKELFNFEADASSVLDVAVEEEITQVLPDIMESMFYFEQAGVGIPREELFKILLAMRQLTDTYPLESCRFWGIMLGVESNYIVAEVEFKEGEDVHEDEGEMSTSNDVPVPIIPSPSATNTGDDDTLQDSIDEQIDVPQSSYKPSPATEKESYGQGCNTKVYFVCNQAGDSWHRLPSITPAQITTARQIRKLLTGDLEAEVISYPPFPGKESNYLRAQIARITSATHISPQGYFIFEEEEEEDEDGSGREHFVRNDEFEGMPVSDLADPSLSFWVHHTPFILPQGRCSWWSPRQQPGEEEGEEEDDENDDDEEDVDEPEPETGPPLLTPLSEDNEVNGMAAWTVSKTSTLLPQYSIAALHSNTWPGAHAFAIDRKHACVYIGYGLKYSHDNYSPPAPPPTQEEYPIGPDVAEVDDPTVEEERALQAAQQEALEAEEEEEDSDEGEDD